MRSYENSGFNPYNSNDRSQTRGSRRNYYSNDYDITNQDRGSSRTNTSRDSSDFGSGFDTFSNSGYAGSSMNFNRSGEFRNSDDNYNYGSMGNRSGNDRGQYGSNYGSSNYGSSGNYGSSNYGSGSRWGNDRNRHDDDNSFWENTKNKASNAWDSVTGDDDNDNYRNRNYGSSGGYNSNRGYSSDRGYDNGSSYSGRFGSDNDYGSSSGNYSSGSAGTYGSGSLGSGATGYGSNSSMGSNSGYGNATYGTGYTTSNYGTSYGSSDRDRYSSGTDRNRYSSDYDRNNNYGRNRDHDEDRGFFDKATEKVRSWFGDDEDNRGRHSNDSRYGSRDYDNDRYGRTTGKNTYNGPPYSYGSSSRRDYEW